MANNIRFLIKLSCDDVIEILDELFPISPDNVINFGLKLKVSRNTIRQFEIQYNRNMSDVLREILYERVKQESPLTRSEIVTALRSPSVKEHELANRIESQYNIMPRQAPQHVGIKISSSTTIQPTSQAPSTENVLEHEHPTAKRLRVQPGTSVQTWEPSSHSDSSGSGGSALFNQFIAFVKTKYKGYKVERDPKVLKWPPTPTKVFINLACIDRKADGIRNEYDDITEAMVLDGNVDVIHGKKWPVDLKQVALNLPSNTLETVILIEGAPGVGKSTFAWEFCRRWMKGEIAQQYRLVLLLRLRDERVSRAKTLKDLIYHVSDDVHESVCKELDSSLGAKTLIVLEGFDELPDACRTVPSLFLELIYGEILPMATIMVTSRPWATSVIRENCGHRIFQHIEILGFTKEQISSYVQSVFSDNEREICDLESYIEKHPQIRMCMYIPLNCAIVVTVYQENQGSECTLPKTLTELYIALTRTLLIRHLRGHPEYKGKNHSCLKMLNDLPLPEEIHRKISELSMIAYNGIFDTDDQPKIIFRNLPSDFDNLGFMDSVTELYATQGTVSSHNFLHLTFQEFFAAVYISTMSPDRQFAHFVEFKKKFRLKVVLKFLAGLSKLNCFSRQTAHMFLESPLRLARSTYSRYSLSCDATINNALVSWIFESQSEDVIAIILGEKRTIVAAMDEDMLPMDCYSLGYCIEHSQCQWVLSIDYFIITPYIAENIKMMAAGASKATRTGGRVVEIFKKDVLSVLNVLTFNVGELNMWFTEWKSLFLHHQISLSLPAPCDCISWPNLSALQVLEIAISRSKNWKLNILLSHLSLQSLILIATGCGVNLAAEDSEALIDFLTATTHLKEFSMRGSEEGSLDIGSSELEMITGALVSNQSLSLEILKLDCYCSFTDTASDSLAQFITNTATLNQFSICGQGVTFSAHGLLMVAQTLDQNKIFNFDILKFTVKDERDLISWARLESEYPHLIKQYSLVTGDLVLSTRFRRLNLCSSGISDRGAAALAEVLRTATLSVLDLSRNNITGTGAEAISNSITRHNCNFRDLNMSNNRISYTGAVAFAQSLLRHSLQSLDLSNCDIGDTGAIALARALHHNDGLSFLDLGGDNGIGKEGTHQLVQALAVNKSVSQIILPRMCLQHASQCGEYNSVKERISFSSN